MIKKHEKHDSNLALKPPANEQGAAKLFVGIDAGVTTGFAIWDGQKLELHSLNIIEAMEKARQLFTIEPTTAFYLEDARLRKWFAGKGKEALQGAGSIKRDCQIWETFFDYHRIRVHLVAPKNNLTKLSAEQFKKITGYQGRSNEHTRDAGMLVYGRK